MDAGRFDEIARALGTSRSRRAGLKAALGGLAGLAVRPAVAKGDRAASECDVCGSGCRFTTIGAALGAGLAHVRVAPGVYLEHDLVVRTADTRGRASITRCGDSGEVIIDAESKGRAIKVERVAAPLLEDLVIRNGDASNQFGGGVLFRDPPPNATLRRVAVTGCSALAGGGVAGAFDAITLEDCDISGNFATQGGGLRVAAARTVSFSGVVFRDNVSMTNAGGADIGGVRESIRLASVTFWKNEARSGLGGGLYLNHPGPTTLTGVTFWDNHAHDDGGGAVLEGGTTTLDDVIIRDNTSGATGGGLRVINAVSSTFRNVTVTNNEAGDGAGLWVESSQGTTLQAVEISGNRASGEGGGIHATGRLELAGDVSVWGNTAGNGGGLAGSGTLTCVNGKPKTNAICGNASNNCAGAASSGDCGCDAAPCRTDACGKGTPCPAGFTCEKRGGEKRCECASGVICGTACCAAGQACQGGACVTPTPPCAAKGQTCGQNSGRACCDGLTCASGQTTVEPVCLVPAGGPCQATADCTYGTECTGGRCVQPPAPPACTPTVQPGDDAGLKRALEAGGTVTLGAGSWTLTVRSGGGGGSGARFLDRPGAVVTGAATLVACPGTRPAVRCTAYSGNNGGSCIEVREGGSLGLQGIALGGVAGSAPRNGIVLDDGSRLAMSASSVTGFGIGVNNGNDDSAPISCSAASGNSVCGNADSNCQTLGQPDLFPNCGCCPQPPA